MAPMSGLDADTLARLEAVGWLLAGEPAPGAGPLLAELRRGPDPDGAVPRLLAALETDPDLAREAREDPDLGAPTQMGVFTRA